jgi:SAM-dependent methyltransferase
VKPPPRQHAGRGRYDGLTNVFLFNWPSFAVAGALTFALVFASRFVDFKMRALMLGTAMLIFAGIVSVVGITHWIYDRSNLYSWDWLLLHVPMPPKRILNIHAGYDESADALARLFPKAEIINCDIFDPTYATSPSIVRARERNRRRDTLRGTTDRLPIDDDWADLVVGFLALHEVRDSSKRKQLFSELRRVTTASARMIIVEHLRDAANLAVYGPGAFHFLPRQAWLDSTQGSFSMGTEQTITPFVHVLEFKRV